MSNQASYTWILIKDIDKNVTIFSFLLLASPKPSKSLQKEWFWKEFNLSPSKGIYIKTNKRRPVWKAKIAEIEEYQSLPASISLSAGWWLLKLFHIWTMQLTPIHKLIIKITSSLVVKVYKCLRSQNLTLDSFWYFVMATKVIKII